MKIHTGDMVRITSGKDKGKQAKVLRVYPKTNKVQVEGCNIQIKHRKPYAGQAGQRITRSMPLHVSKVALLNSEGQLDRVGYKVLKDGTKLRTLRKSGETMTGVAVESSKDADKEIKTDKKSKDQPKKSTQKTTPKKATDKKKNKKK